MQLSRQPRRMKPIGMTALIDVVFLLLIFFMLASTFLSFSSVPISSARGGGVANSEQEVAIIQVGVGGVLTVNGQPTRVETLGENIETLIGKGITHAVIRPRADATVQDLVSVLEIGRGSKLKDIVVLK